MPRLTKGRGLAVAGVACLLAILVLQLTLSIRGESQIWDEGDHIFAGYRAWTHRDFGLNPEHPPLVKLLATLPLLAMNLRGPAPQNRYFKTEVFLDGRDFVYGNDADAILFRTRMTAALLTIALALLVFSPRGEMFGTGAGLLALAILVFEPNLLAHGALVTTDAGLTCFLLAAVYAFYRYLKSPSAWRLAVTGIAAGLALATKHTGLLVLPMLALLAGCELVLRRRGVVRLAASVLGVAALAVAVLWACYGFRYQARPEGLRLNPPLERLVRGIKPRESAVVSALARWRVLPESSSSYIFGKVYRHGVWFYFPAAFLIKSTAGFLALLALVLAAVALRQVTGWRGILFLTVPPLFYLLVAMSSGLNIGARHILPLYAFLTVLAAGAAWTFLRRSRRWAGAVALLLLVHAASSARSFPVYLAYSNELWGGPSNTYKYLTDSNTDWAQQLKATSRYLAARGVTNCWFAYFADVVVRPASYGIPCKSLPTIASIWLREVVLVPAEIDGPVLISAGSLSGYETGPGAVNPYDQFQRLRPAAVIEHGVFVYDGHFAVPLASAITHAIRAQGLLAGRRADEALEEARTAVAADPGSVRAQSASGDALRALHRPDEARAAYQVALDRATRVEPEFQQGWVAGLRAKLAPK